MSIFWTEVRRPIAAVVVLIAAVAGIGLGVGGCGTGESSSKAHADEVRQANRLCDQAIERLERMPPVYIATYGRVVPAIARNERALARKLIALEVRGEDESSFERLADLMTQQASEVDGAAAAYAGKEVRLAAYERHVRQAQRLNGKIEIAAKELGARACTRPPVRTRYL